MGKEAPLITLPFSPMQESQGKEVRGCNPLAGPAAQYARELSLGVRAMAPRALMRQEAQLTVSKSEHGTPWRTAPGPEEARETRVKKEISFVTVQRTDD